MINIIQRIARMFFRAIVVSLLILNFDHKAIWGLPLGILIAICSEAEVMIKK